MLEYGLGELVLTVMPMKSMGLNPYYAGIWSRRHNILQTKFFIIMSLNPYYAGIWSRSAYISGLDQYYSGIVLILIMLEYGLGEERIFTECVLFTDGS